jgi:ABC-type phosphate transport system substrate-binding protein
MRTRSAISAVLFLLTSFAPCFAHHMAVVVNKENSVGNVTSAHLAKILREEVKKWPDGKDVVLVFHRNSAGETETLQRLNKMSQAEWNAFLESHKDSIVFADTDADVLKMVQNDPRAVGLIDVRSINGTVTVVHVDGKLPMESGYLPH